MRRDFGAKGLARNNEELLSALQRLTDCLAIGLGHHLVNGTWQGPGILKFIPPDVDHSVWFFRDDVGRFTEWYVNLEERALRWDDGGVAGIDVVDQDLDIVVAPDRTWWWKDEDEFAERLALPEHYWVQD